MVLDSSFGLGMKLKVTILLFLKYKLFLINFFLIFSLQNNFNTFVFLESFTQWDALTCGKTLPNKLLLLRS